jgi:hypothetical protein
MADGYQFRTGSALASKAQPDRPPFQIEGVTGHGTVAHPIQAQTYPVRVRPIRGAFLFIGSLPQSACVYQNLAMTASQGPGQSTLGLSGIYTGSCAPTAPRAFQFAHARSHAT